MAIQMKRGELADLDKSRLSAGEIVVATDQDYVGVAKAPSNVVQLATIEDVQTKGNFYAIENGCFTYYPLPVKNEWIQHPNLPISAFESAAVVFQNKIHLLGGSDNKKAHWSWDGSEWTQETDIPVNMQFPSAVVFEDKIHIFYNNYHYSWDGSVWTQEINAPSAVAIVGNGHAVIYGGYLTLVSSNEGSYGFGKYICQLINGSWVKRNVVGNVIYYTTSTYGDLIYLIGDSGSGGKNYKTWDSTEMSEESALPYSLKFGSSVVYNNKLHILGSQNASNVKKHYCYNGSSWAKVSQLPYDFYYGSVVVYKDALHIFGGLANNTKYNHRSFIEASIYATNYTAYVYKNGTITTNDGSRSPVTKKNNGDSVCFAVRNGHGSGDWMVTVCIALREDAALLVVPTTSPRVNSIKINEVTYYYCIQSSNEEYGGATEISTPLNIPIFDDWFICNPDETISQSKFEEIIDTLGIEVA